MDRLDRAISNNVMVLSDGPIKSGHDGADGSQCLSVLASLSNCARGGGPVRARTGLSLGE